MELTQAHYQLIESYLPVQRGNVTIPNIRVLNATLYVAEHGCKWRGLPTRFGNWHTVYMRMNRWSRERSARPSVRTASAEGDREGHHRGGFTGQHLRQGASRRHGCGQKNGPQSIGKSRGGWTTKLHMVAADDRTPIAFSLSPGQAHDGPEGRKLLDRLGPQQGNPPLVMDRAYSGDQTRRLAFDMGFMPVVPPLKSRVNPWEYDKELYKRRNEVERLFRRLKGYRRVFTRYDKLDVLYTGFVLFAIIFDALRSVNRP